jgi:primary-amine oxidase
MDDVRALYMATGTDPSARGLRGRLVRVMFGADQDATNDYGPILDGLAALVDVYAGRVVRLYDRPSPPIVKVPHDIFDPEVRGEPAAPPVRPVTVTGRSFTVDGNVMEWGPWRLRLSFNGREGLVLYQISFDDHGKRRPVVYRASVSEILSRYGAADLAWPWMEFFDESNFGLGTQSVPVTPGREVPANALTLSPVPASAESESRIFAYERDAGNLMYYRQEDLTVQRRATELVVGFLVPLGNYTYALSWVFKQDGSFAFEAELAGEILTRLVRTSDRRRDARASGTLVSPHVLGVDHQHWFNLRLDFDVDGPANAIVENNVRPPAGRRGAGPSFSQSHTLLRRAVDARRDAEDATSRTWTIFNPASRLATGDPVGYEVVPLGNTSTVYPRSRETGPAGFTFHHLWATPYREGELFADGRYPNQPTRRNVDTLYNYSNSESIRDRDIVVWYSLAETHVPRPEDYPLMTDMKVSVLFRPNGFFARNPVFGGPLER